MDADRAGNANSRTEGDESVTTKLLKSLSHGKVECKVQVSMLLLYLVSISMRGLCYW